MMARYSPDLGDLWEGGATYSIEEEDERPNGSFTITRATLEAGYQVGFIPRTDRVRYGVTSWATTKSPEALEYLIWACAERFKGICAYVGFWKDEEGVFHVDPSEHYDTLKGALHYGRSFGQLTVWDWANMDEVKVPVKEVI